MVSRLTVLFSLVGLASGARVSRNRVHDRLKIQGAPVHVRSQSVIGSQEVFDWTIFFQEGATTSDLVHFCRERCTTSGSPSEGGVPFAQFHGSENKLADFLHGHTDIVSFIEPEVLENALPEDTLQQLSSDSSMWGLERIGVSERTNQGEGVNIYVIDTGIRTTHLEFGGRAVAAVQTNYGRPEVCDAVTTDCAKDGNGHGTHCAGTAGGNTFGVANRAKLHGVKSVSDSGRGFQSWVVIALDWMATDALRPAVASISLQYNGESWSMETSVKRATQAGITVVVAAGNVNNFACDFSPAYVPEAITVGATTPADAKAQFSNLGSCVNIWAPGTGIKSATSDADDASDSWDGTSMAAPHVTGAVALLLADNPSLTRDGIMAALQANGEKDALTGLYGSDSNLLVSVRGTR